MKRLILEVSLKPFFDTSPKAIEATIRQILNQWRPLIDTAERISFLLWTAEGSEILDYRGRLQDEIQWAKWVGVANDAPTSPSDPDRKGLHSNRWPYCEHPPILTYQLLQEIVLTLKSLAIQLTGKPTTIGAIFDPGPEFAESDFKYKRHPEVNKGSIMGHQQWMHCAGVLHADTEAYAGFPNGIPEGTSIGTFLGRQSQYFLTDLGFDYLWLSNGFGYSLDSWNVTGEIFDGQTFDTSNARQVNESILQFWRDFRRECPAVPIETRGSNLSTAMDLASDGSPLREIYAGGFNLTAPVNSPWAAINGDYGLELVGWLSHIAELPEGDIVPFRYYIHDPWWLNSPWLDRYGREPHDIYLPLATARVGRSGAIVPPDSVALLTIDDSFGRMPEEVPLEIIPHLRRAFEDFSDEPGLVTWIYPFDEYHDRVFANPSRASEVFFGDWFMRAAINQGFPLNTVVSTENFLSSLAARPATYDRTILVCPVPDAGTPLSEALLKHLTSGGQVLLYGPLDHSAPAILELLNVEKGESLTGNLTFHTSLKSDSLQTGSFPENFLFRAIVSGGGLDNVLLPSVPEDLEILAEATSGAESRLFAALRSLPGGGRLGWVRGALGESVSKENMLPVPDNPEQWFRSERIMRWMLDRFGVALRFDKPSIQTPDPIVLASRCRGAWYFSGYSPSTQVTLKWRFPEGVPIPVGCDIMLADSLGSMPLLRAWHRECRIFVSQSESGEVTCQEQYSGEWGIKRRLRVSGLKNATVTFLPDSSEPERAVRFQKHEGYLGLGANIPFHTELHGQLVAERVTGELLVSW
jgi:hypothetical protein